VHGTGPDRVAPRSHRPTDPPVEKGGEGCGRPNPPPKECFQTPHRSNHVLPPPTDRHWTASLSCFLRSAVIWVRAAEVYRSFASCPLVTSRTMLRNCGYTTCDGRRAGGRTEVGCANFWISKFDADINITRRGGGQCKCKEEVADCCGANTNFQPRRYDSACRYDRIRLSGFTLFLLTFLTCVNICLIKRE